MALKHLYDRRLAIQRGVSPAEVSVGEIQKNNY